MNDPQNMFQARSGVKVFVSQGEQTFLAFVPCKHDIIPFRVDPSHLHHVQITSRANWRNSGLFLEDASNLLIHLGNFHNVAYKHPLEEINNQTILSFIGEEDIVQNNPVMWIQVGKISK